MATILIQHGRVIDPASGFDQAADVLLADGVVAEIGRLAAPRGARTIDAEGCLVCPGLIDPHVHLREPDHEHHETVATGAAAAVAGGFTAVCCMPNTRPPIDTAPSVQFVRRRGEQAGGARVFVAAAATEGRRGERPAPIREMAEAGAVAFTDDGECVSDPRVLRLVLQTAAAAGCPFLQHCQDPQLSADGVMNAGALATRLGLGAWPAAAEEAVIERDIRLNRRIGCAYHAQHLSSGDSVEIIRRARADGQPVSAEVSPHHLLLTEACCADYDPMFKVNPPLRSLRDIGLLKEGVADGTIQILGTDHAPHPAHRKHVDFADAAFGLVGLECALPLYLEALVADGVIDVVRLLAMLTINPAKLLGLDGFGLGSLTVGGPADVTVIDPDAAWTIDPAAFASTGRNCPFAGRSVRGRAVATIVGGELRFAYSATAASNM